MMPKLHRWLDAAAEIEAELLSSEHLDAELVDAVGVALVERRAHVRLVVDFVAPDSPRLRVRVVDRRGGWWLLDTWGQVAPPVKNIARAQRRFDASSALRMGEAAS